MLHSKCLLHNCTQREPVALRKLQEIANAILGLPGLTKKGRSLDVDLYQSAMKSVTCSRLTTVMILQLTLLIGFLSSFCALA